MKLCITLTYLEKDHGFESSGSGDVMRDVHSDVI